MATGTAGQGPSDMAGAASRSEATSGLVGYGEFIDSRLNRTRLAVKGVDVFRGLMALAAATLAFFLLATVVDHWLAPGGLGFWGRLAAFVVLVAGGGAFAAMLVIPPLIRRVNPVFAAQAIERFQPGLKNSLINFLMLRGQTAATSAPLLSALEEQAATNLSRASSETAVDRTPLVRFGLLLLGSVAACALYVALSPKDPFASAARVAAPWADIDAPTRTAITDIEVRVVETQRMSLGGNARARLGQHVRITAAVHRRGREFDEPVTLRITTDDGQTVDQPVVMERDSQTFYAVLPAAGETAMGGRGGLQQSFSYTITADDATRGPFHVEVDSALTIDVQSIDYDFPTYTRLPARRVEGEGDVRALEGTKVTLRARANQPIRAAYIDFDCDGRRDRPLSVDGLDATISFTLALEDDRRTPVHDCYLLRFTNEDGQENPQPIRYRIEVTPDLEPEVVFVAPEDHDEPLEIAVDGRALMIVRAADRDFDLVHVALLARPALGADAVAGAAQGMEVTLLDEARMDQFQNEPFAFTPGEHGFQAGDLIEYWAAAHDNRRPEANTVTTARRLIRVLEASQPPDEPTPMEKRPDDEAANEPEDNSRPPEADPKDGASDDSKPSGDAEQEPGEGSRGDDQAAPNETGQNGAGEQGGGANDAAGGQEQQPGEGERVDPDAQAGDAFEKILEHFDEQGAGENKNQDGGSSNSGEQAAGETTNEDDGSSASKPAGAANGGKQGADAESSGQPSDAGNAGGAANQSKSANDEGNADTRRNEAASSEKPTASEPSEAMSPDGGRKPMPGDGASGPASLRPEQAPDGAQQEPGASSPTGEDQSNRSAGSGESNEEQVGVPEAQGANRPRDKTPRPSQQRPDDAEERSPAASPSISDHESDSQGDQSGDRSGGGEEGGGQRANQPGEGGPGGNTPSDAGAGAANDSGDGQTAGRAGEKTAADQPVDGAESQTQAKGSDAAESASDEGQAGRGTTKPGGANQAGNGDASAARPGDGQPGDGQPGDGQPGDMADAPMDGNAGGATGPAESARPGDAQAKSGGASESTANSAKPPQPNDESGGDDPNLDYARKATDLVLEQLKDQLAKEKPDPDLLDKLKWTREDLENFVGRWQAMKQDAQRAGNEGEQARSELNDALRGLGLRPSRVAIEGGKVADDELRGMRQSYRSEPPRDYAEQYRQYTTGASKGAPSRGESRP